MESLRHSGSKATMDYLAGFEDESSKKNYDVLMEGLEWDHFKFSIAKEASKMGIKINRLNNPQHV